MSELLVVEIPPSIEQYRKLLERFVEGMVMKLDKNSHKQTPTLKSVPAIIDDMMLEVDEFELQFFENKDDENTLIELFDVANFAFLAYIALRNQGVEHGQQANAADNAQPT